MTIIDIIFPKKCIICGENGVNICNQCKQNAQKYKIQQNGENFYGFKYRNELRKALIRYKFSGKKSYIYALTELFLETLNNVNFDEYDIISYVPISKSRMHERGYNQAKLICDGACKVKNIKSSNIFKKRRNKRQANLSVDKREENVRGKFVLKSEVKGKNILMFDDVETTGSTVKEITKTLIDAGAKRVSFCILFKK